ncbi:MAG: hypothetical protein DI640_04875 [Sphingomonas taxi]|uniref:RING-CH-type domain-containing protein n=1 Tax=Sphingomonas taxi TaxID=1549858 RepID=A0A2W4Z1Y3_9SPHN|nr:MAG: hypothetical protein DI640_04875 [Sphingomonas taxi]
MQLRPCRCRGTSGWLHGSCPPPRWDWP